MLLRGAENVISFIARLWGSEEWLPFGGVTDNKSALRRFLGKDGILSLDLGGGFMGV